VDTCVACEAGRYQMETGKKACKLNSCLAGEYLSSDADKCQKCKWCPTGTYAGAQLAATTCIDCAVGMYADEKGTTTCKGGAPCGAGTWGLTAQKAKISSPATCTTSGTNNDCAAATTSALCAAATTSGGGAVTANACVFTPAGDNNNACTNCVAGKYAAANTATQCTNCAVGTFALAAQETCIGCADGKSVAVGPAGTSAAACIDCVAGKYAAKIAPAACIDCAVGKYAVAAQTDCKDCDVGKSVGAGLGKLADSDASCTTICATGKFAGAGDPLGCQNCARGKYNDQTGQTTCVKPSVCAKGQGLPAALFPGATTEAAGCAACLIGTYNDLTTDAPNSVFGYDCRPNGCVAGTAQSEEGRGEGSAPKFLGCENCCAGSSSAGGAAQCAVCPAGTYNDVEAAACKPSECAAGSGINAVTGATTNAATCATCAPGQYSDQTGAQACKVCEVGKYQDETTGTTACK
jgi:hypothetical protein